VRYRIFYLVIDRFSDPIELTSHITKMFTYINYTSLFEYKISSSFHTNYHGIFSRRMPHSGRTRVALEKGRHGLCRKDNHEHVLDEGT
jgi:hypothetical protein